MINRVAGVFARRGYNIESLAVGLNIDRALFTIVVIGTDEEIEKLMKQIYKLPNVIKARGALRGGPPPPPQLTPPSAQCEDLTYVSCVERGLMLMKIAAEPSQRREILDLAQIFRAAVVDVGDRSMMLAVTGDPGKTRAFQLAMAKFGVEEVARTGKLALRREVAYSETRRERLQSAQRSRDAPPSPDAQEAASPGKPRAAAPPPAATPGGDVYKLEASDLTGVWDYAVLAPYWGDGEGVKDTKRGQYKPHTLSLSVENKPGVLDRVTGVIARRGYNVQSLGVGPAERPDISRITLVVPGTDADVEKLRQQLLKVTSVLDAADITHIPFVERELMLVKVAAATRLRGELTDLAAVFRAKVSDISGDTLTIEVTGKNEKLAQLQELLEPYGILEVARTGRVALTRDMGVNTVLLESLADVGDH